MATLAKLAISGYLIVGVCVPFYVPYFRSRSVDQRGIIMHERWRLIHTEKLSTHWHWVEPESIRLSDLSFIYIDILVTSKYRVVEEPGIGSISIVLGATLSIGVIIWHILRQLWAIVQMQLRTYWKDYSGTPVFYMNMRPARLGWYRKLLGKMARDILIPL